MQTLLSIASSYNWDFVLVVPALSLLVGAWFMARDTDDEEIRQPRQQTNGARTPAEAEHEPASSTSARSIFPRRRVIAANGAQRDDVEILQRCTICLEHLPTRNVHVIGGCFHSFCRSCLARVVTQHTSDKKFPVACPAPDCHGSIAVSECAVLVADPEVLEELQKLEVEHSIPSDERLYCPYSSCSALVMKPAGMADSDPGSAECPSCHRLLCARCAVAWHADLTCAEYQRLPAHMRSAEDRQLAQLAAGKRWRKCPQCHVIIERESGCNHMTCRCSHEFCYLCGSSYSARRKQCSCQLFEAPPDDQ